MIAKLDFSASLLQSSMSHDPSEIIYFLMFVLILLMLIFQFSFSLIDMLLL